MTDKTWDQHLKSTKYQRQWNLSNSNANFSKLPDFLKTTDGPDFFHCNLLQKNITDFSNFNFSKKSIFRTDS